MGRRPSNVVVGDERANGKSIENTLYKLSSSARGAIDDLETLLPAVEVDPSAVFSWVGTTSKHVLRAFNNGTPLERKTICLISLFDKRSGAIDEDLDDEEDEGESSFKVRISANRCQY
jgi:hypothetical protein